MFKYYKLYIIIMLELKRALDMKTNISLKISHFFKSIQNFGKISKVKRPNKGWICYFRTCLNMSQAQLAAHLGISQPGVKALELSEQNNRITLSSLNQIAAVFNCDVVYTFVPKSNMGIFLKQKAEIVAEKEIRAVGHSMGLENQAIGETETKNLIRSRIEELMYKPERVIWN